MLDNVYTIEYNHHNAYEWNDAKSMKNRRKHGVSFEEACTVWQDGRSVEFYSDHSSTQEDRYIRIGHSTKPRLLTVVFCERKKGKRIRIISARKSTKAEELFYEKGI